MKRPTPLAALRVFEAAARHRSFNRAAEELHVTPSAVSHQIRGLEEHLGVKLFARLTRQVRLTREGEDFLAPVQAALDQIESAVQRIGGRGDDASLTLQVSPNFATEWLVPRLLGFQAHHPEIEVRLVTTRGHDAAHFDRESYDLGVWYGKGDWPDVECERLMSEELVPVCSPALLEADEHRLRSPDDLRHATLIHVLIRIGQWRNWLHAAGVHGVDADRGPKFQNTPLALEAAVAGMGVAIANRAFVAGHLNDGRLVIPFEIEMPSASAYYLLYPKNRLNRPSVAAFRDWILDVVRSEDEQGSAMLEGVPGLRQLS